MISQRGPEETTLGLFSLFWRRHVKDVAKLALPASVVASLKHRQKRVRWGDLRRLTPISRSFGLDRGQPIDRYYIERFLAQHAADVRGRVLEIGDNTYTCRFGGHAVTHSEVLHVQPGHANATIVADLARDDQIPANRFDCIICTQTLMFIYDVPAAIRTLQRVLKPGGVALVTVAGISQICRWDMDQWGDYWRFTSLSARRLFDDVFGPPNISVLAFGNVLSSVALMLGLAVDDLSPSELDHADRDYEMVVCVRARKAAELGIA